MIDIINPYSSGKVYVYSVVATPFSQVITEGLKSVETEVIFRGLEKFSPLTEGDQVILLLQGRGKIPKALIATGATVHSIDLNKIGLGKEVTELMALLPNILQGLIPLLPSDTTRLDEIKAWAAKMGL